MHLKIRITIVKMFGPCMVEVLSCDGNVIRHLVLHVTDRDNWIKSDGENAQTTYLNNKNKT